MDVNTASNWNKRYTRKALPDENHGKDRYLVLLILDAVSLILLPTVSSSLGYHQNSIFPSLSLSGLDIGAYVE